AMNIHQLVVIAIHKVIGLVQHIGKATGHARTKIDTGLTKHCHHTARHVFAAVISGALYNHISAGLTHTTALTGSTCSKQFTARSAVEAGITHDAGFVGFEARVAWRTQYYLATSHAFANIIVGLTLKVHIRSTRSPHAKTLT